LLDITSIGGNPRFLVPVSRCQQLRVEHDGISGDGDVELFHSCRLLTSEMPTENPGGTVVFGKVDSGMFVFVFAFLGECFNEEA